MLERDTFNKFCSSEYPGLVAYAELLLGRGNASWAEDVVQDVLYSVWKRRYFINWNPSVGGGKIHAYCLRSVFNRCINYLKHRNTHLSYESNEILFLQTAQRYYDPDSNPVIRHIFDSDIRTAIDASVESLPEKCREVFRLSYIEGLSHAEIAQKFGISVRTVDAHVYSALRSLRHSLEGV